MPPTKASRRSRSMAAARRESAISTALDAIRDSVKQGNEQINQRVSDLAAALDTNHRQNKGDIEQCFKEISSLKERVQSHDTTLFSMVGRGDGETGSLNELRKGQTDTQKQLAGVQKTVEVIEERTRDLNKTKTFMERWKGVGTAVGIIGVIATVVMAVIGVVKLLH